MKSFILILCFVLTTTDETNEKCPNCYYGITRNSENEYLMVKNIFSNLFSKHWNITMDSLSNLQKSSTTFLKTCDVLTRYSIELQNFCDIKTYKPMFMCR